MVRTPSYAGGASRFAKFPSADARVALSVVIPTLDEAEQIGSAVSQLRWADEVIVVDGGSRDDTVAIAETAGARVLVVTGETIAVQRNAGIAAVRNDWVLSLDADERVDATLVSELARVVSAGQARHSAYRIRFRNVYLGRELQYGPWGHDWHVRLFPRERRYLSCRVHERLESAENVGTLAGTITHRSYRDLTHHVTKIMRYSRWAADDLRSRGRRATLADIAVRPAWRFVRDYVVMSGWRDGVPGFIAAATSAFAVFLKYALLLTDARSSRA